MVSDMCDVAFFSDWGLKIAFKDSLDHKSHSFSFYLVVCVCTRALTLAVQKTASGTGFLHVGLRD